jgi:hypothetical protein
MNSNEESKYRESIRLELQREHDERLAQETKTREARVQVQAESRRRSIQDEERRAFFEGHEGFIEVESENGESEWLTRKQIRDREGYFDYEDLVENPERGRRFVTLRLIFASFFFLAILATGYWYMREVEGRIHVVSDPPGCHVLVDGQDSGYLTDCLLELPIGEHMIEVYREGYRVQEPSLHHLLLRRGGEHLLEFTLEPLYAPGQP